MQISHPLAKASSTGRRGAAEARRRRRGESPTRVTSPPPNVTRAGLSARASSPPAAAAAPRRATCSGPPAPAPAPPPRAQSSAPKWVIIRNPSLESPSFFPFYGNDRVSRHPAHPSIRFEHVLNFTTMLMIVEKRYCRDKGLVYDRARTRKMPFIIIIICFILFL